MERTTKIKEQIQIFQKKMQNNTEKFMGDKWNGGNEAVHYKAQCITRRIESFHEYCDERYG